MKRSPVVFVVEDNPDWQKTIEQELTNSGHTVAARTRSLREALDAIPQLGEECTVATLDYGLSEAYEASEGATVLAELRRQRPEMKVVGLSTVKFPGKVDADVTKIQIERLGDVVTDL